VGHNFYVTVLYKIAVSAFHQVECNYFWQGAGALSGKLCHIYLKNISGIVGLVPRCNRRLNHAFCNGNFCKLNEIFHCLVRPFINTLKKELNPTKWQLQQCTEIGEHSQALHDTNKTNAKDMSMFWSRALKKIFSWGLCVKQTKQAITKRCPMCYLHQQLKPFYAFADAKEGKV